MEAQRNYRHALVLLLSCIAFVSGITALMTAFIKRFPMELQTFLPVHYSSFHRTLTLLLGFVLIYFSLQLLQRKQSAWFISLVGTVLVMARNLQHHLPLVTLLFPLLTFGLLLTLRHEFVVKNELESIRQGILFFIFSLLIAFCYGTVGFYLLDKRELGIDFSFIASITRVLREFLLIGNNDLVAHTKYAQWFLDSLDLLGIVSISFGVYSLFRPLRYRYITLPHERKHAQDLIERYSPTTEDFFKLWPEDKSFFFDETKKAVIVYKPVSGAAISRGDPVGQSQRIEPLLRSFTSYCLRNGWVCAFVHVLPNHLAIYQDLGYRIIKIGEDAVVDLSQFAAKGERDKYFRNLKNKFAKQGYSVTRIVPPVPTSVLKQLRHVSQAWLTLPGKKEQGFAMGYFDPNYLKQMTIFALYNDQGKIVAFLNQIPSFRQKQASIDLMRYQPKSLPGAMDYLLMQTMLLFHNEGYKTFDLGFAALSGDYETPERSVTDRVFKLFYESNHHFFSFQGLRQFKNKFDPFWEPRYLAYKSGPGNLIRTTLGLRKAFQLEDH